jgi:hypothetical protein
MIKEEVAEKININILKGSSKLSCISNNFPTKINKKKIEKIINTSIPLLYLGKFV